jgi:alpha-L-arabinofuranosidase
MLEMPIVTVLAMLLHRTQNAPRRTQALCKLDALYSFKDSVLHQVRTIFFDNIQDHYYKPTHAIQQWINTYQPLILKSSSKDSKTSSLLHVWTLTHYFGEKS